DEGAAKKWLKPGLLDVFEELVGRVEALDDWSVAAIQALYDAICEERGLGLGKIAQPTRVAVTGNTVSPGLFETLYLIGQPIVVERMKVALDYIRDRAAAQ